MLYCDECAEERGVSETHHKSIGKCEICGRIRVCEICGRIRVCSDRCLMI